MGSSAVAQEPSDRGDLAVDPVLLLPVAVLVSLGAAWISLSSGGDPWRVAADLVIVWALLSAAVVALVHPPLKRTGVLMAALAGTYLLPYLEGSSWPLLWTTGLVLEAVWTAVFVHLVVAFPEGRLRSLPARALVIAAYAAVIGNQVLAAFAWPATTNLLLINGDRPFVDSLWRIAASADLIVALAFFAFILRRIVRLRGASRRLALPVLVGAALAVPITVVRLAAIALGSSSLSDQLEPADRLTTLLIPIGFFVGLAWARARRAGASNLVVELRAGGAPTMRDRLARALGDPSLEVVHWQDETGGFVDATGHGILLPIDGDRAVTQVHAGGLPIAALIHDPALLDDPGLLESVAATSGLVLENERLAAEVRAQLDEVRASRARLVVAADAERQRLERDLHDGAQQRLVGLVLKLRLAEAQADDGAAATLAQAREDLERALAELREFARGIHPTILREDGLVAAIEALARRTPIPVEIEGEIQERLPEAVEIAAYFFVSEALTNAAKHARARRATVHLERRAGVIAVSVTDDGVGGARLVPGFGLAGLADRLAALDGVLRLDSPSGVGTTVRAEIPCAS